ncbi:MAG: hypothetical protein LJE61_10380 [Thiocapsa sp.]|nr:hypothetical protein [Thiocapsa sp.]MCG6898228.1 hypothetical protein [Thiocapsa sp.]MCG6985585.1 hypothetical protein [Thiocapsa sp.]
MAVVLGALHADPSAAGLTGLSWDACRDRVIAALEAAGQRDFGDVSAYTGASGAGALVAVIERCGYRPERLSRADCDDLYEQVYNACRLEGFDGMSVSATSWVLIYDPEGALVERLRHICARPDRASRTEFGVLVCGE